MEERFLIQKYRTSKINLFSTHTIHCTYTSAVLAIIITVVVHCDLTGAEGSIQF